MINDFDIALKYTLRFEGGYVNDPLDSGGATNKGITQKTYNAFSLKYGLPIRSVASITEHEVVKIYFENYWKEFKCDALPSPLSIAVFDFCVNSGSNGIKKLQQCLGVNADGIIGNDTLHAVFSFCKTPEKVNDLLKTYLAKRRQFFYGIVTRKPLQVRFLKGWIRRVNELSELLVDG